MLFFLLFFLTLIRLYCSTALKYSPRCDSFRSIWTQRRGGKESTASLMTRSSRGGRKKERDLDRCVCMKGCDFFWRGVFNLWVLQRQRPHHGRSTTLLLLLPSQATAVPTKTFPHTTACRRPDACIMMQIALITHFSWCVWCVCVCL